MVGQVVTALILSIILIVFQTFSITQQSSWAQQQQSSSSSFSSDFEQFAQRVREAAQGAGVTGSVQEYPGDDFTQFWWSEGQCGQRQLLQALSRTEAACTGSDTRIYIESREADALEMFNTLLDGPGAAFLGAEEFDVGTSQKGYTKNVSLAFSNPFEGRAYGDALFLCGTITGTVSKFSKTSTEQAPPNATDEQLESIWQQKKGEADAKAAAHRAEVESLAKTIVQALVTNGLCIESKNPLLPVIFLPGVAGTQLYSGDSIVWPTVYFGDRADLALKDDGRTPLFTGTQINVGDIFDKPLYNFYGSMIKYLKRNGYQENENLFLFPYDWRMDNFLDQVPALDKLVDQARTQSGSQKVILLAHSMGGLIARAYAQQHPDKVDSLITMGTPWWGALKVFYALVNGYTFGNRAVGEKIMKVLTQNTAAAYQLLPKVPFVIDDKMNRTIPLQELYDTLRYHGFHQKDKDESVTCSTKMILDSFKKGGSRDCEEDVLATPWKLNTALLQTANARYPELIGTKENPVPMPAGVNLYTIIGTGYKTLSSYKIIPPIFQSLRLVTPDNQEGRRVVFEPGFADGDGTVPRWAAENDAAIAKYYVPHGEQSSAHGELAKNKIIQDIVLSILQGNPKDPSEYPPIESGELVDEDQGIDFTLRSDAHMTITDQSSRTGNTEARNNVNGANANTSSIAGPAGTLGYYNINGTASIVETLPTGTFLSIDGREYASIADTSKIYHVDINGIRDGMFALTVNITASDGSVVTLQYPETPVRNGTTAQMDINGDLVAAKLSNDNNATATANTPTSSAVPPPLIVNDNNGSDARSVLPQVTVKQGRISNATATATTNGTTTTTTATPPPPATATTTTTIPSSISAVDLHPDSVPQFFKCGETPDTGLTTLPGLDVQSSTYTAITDGDVNTEILGKAIFDVTFSEPITNGPGPELRVYEIGNDPEPFSVTLFSGDIMTQSIQYSAVASATGDTDDCGFLVNVAEIDLSDFGLGEGGQGSGNEEIIAITGIRVDNQGAEGCCTGADISDVVIVSPAATSGGGGELAEDVPLLPEQQLQQQQQDNESDAEEEQEEEEEEEGGEGQLALAQCDPSYPDVCIPSPPPDLNCGDDGVPENFQVLPPNPHGFGDEDNDGIGCESEQPPTSDTIEPSGGGDSNDEDTEAESEVSGSGDEEEDEDDDTNED